MARSSDLTYSAHMDAVEFTLVGDPQRAKTTVVQALESRKFTLKWGGDWDAVAERGNKVANVLLGAMAQYFKVEVVVRSGADGSSIVRVQKSSSGWMGGAIGAHRTNKNFESLRGELDATFRAAGVLVSAQAG